MEEKLINALADAMEMEASEISILDHFRDYDSYDSLTELSVLAMLDSDFGIEIEMEEYKQYITVKDLLNLIVKKSNN